MKKFYNKEGHLLKPGDPIRIEGYYQNGITFAHSVICDLELLQALEEHGIITSREEEISLEGIPLNLDFYTNIISKYFNLVSKLSASGGGAKKGLKGDENLLQKIADLYPVAAYDILLRAIATHLDSRYPDHIKESPEVWGISSFTGKIVKLNKKAVKYQAFAAFRSKEEAGIACRILRELRKELYGNRK